MNVYTGITVSGVKVWDNNDDPNPPASVTVALLANGEPYMADGKAVTQTVTEGADGTWAFEFDGLPAYDASGKPISYSVAEDVPAGYEAKYVTVGTTTAIVNSFVGMGEVTVSIEKTWDDEDNAEGMRPESVVFELFANGVATGETIVVSAETGWAGSLAVDRFDAKGNEIVYQLFEQSVDGYSVTESVRTVDESGNVSYAVTNAHETSTVSVSGEKLWADATAPAGSRPESITIELYANGELAASQTVTGEGDVWNYSFDGLAKYDGQGREIVYTVAETPVEGYASYEVAGGFMNVFVGAGTVEVSVEKAWDDSANSDGLRPAEVVFDLYANGTATGETLTVSAETGWAGSISGLPRFDASGAAIVYQLVERAVKGYSVTANDRTVDADGNVAYAVTNSHATELTSLAGVKYWSDDNDAQGMRPESIDVNLLANGKVVDTVTVTAEDGWAWSFDELPVYDASGAKISYTMAEAEVPAGYEATVYLEGRSIANALVTTTIDVTKVWADGSDAQGARPASVTLELWRETESTAATKVANVTLTADDAAETDANVWTKSVSGLLAYDASGEAYVYSVAEPKVPAGYEAKVDGLTVTNSRSLDELTFTGTKTWAGDDGAEHDNASEVTLTLWATEGDNTRKVNAKPEWRDVDGDGYAETFVFEGLPAYGTDGTEILYSVTEGKVEGYGTTYSSGADYALNGEGIVNTLINQANVSFPVTKVWDDANDQDGKRPETVEVELLANGQATGQTITLSADNGWTGGFEGLKGFDDDGKVIAYSVRENDVAVGYAASITGDMVSGFTITNSTETDTTFLVVFKRWDDSYDRDGIRPESVTVYLLANGEPTGDTLTLSEDNNWSGYFAGLPVNAGGSQIVYSVYEEQAWGYEAPAYAYGSNVVAITNAHDTGVIDVTATKVWDDDDNAMDLRCDVTLTLIGYSDDFVWEFGSKTVELGGEQTVTWEGVPTHMNGSELSYAVVEDAVFGYASSVELLENEPPADGSEPDPNMHFLVTNTLSAQPTSVHVEKLWADDGDRDGIRPDSVTFCLVAKVGDAEPELVDTQVVWLDEDGAAEYTWRDLPTIDLETEAVISYSVIEDEVPEGYTSHVECAEPGEFVVVNTHNIETVSVSANKVWSDLDNSYQTRPGYITLHLYANGYDTGEKLVLLESDGWAGTFSGLPKYADGELIDYSVVEDGVMGYTGAVAGSVDGGFVVTNTYNDTVNVVATKVWDGEDGDTSGRTDVTLRLYKRVGGYGAVEVEGAEKVIPANATGDGLTVSWTGLPASERGMKVTYVVVEDTVAGYDSHVSEGVWDDTTLSFVVTNTKATGGDTPEPGPGPEPPVDETVLVAFVDYLKDEGSQVVTFERATRAEVEALAAAQAAPEHEGFDFQGWDRNENTDDEGDVLVTFVAQFQDTSTRAIVVSYVDAMMDKGEELVKSEKTTNPDAVEAPADPEHEGCTFTGWSEQVDAGGNIIYVARYEYEPSGGERYVAVDPPVRKVVEGNPANMPEFGFVMAAEDEAAPMPSGSTLGSKAVTLRGSGSVEFGTIVYSQPGTYAYRIYEVVEEREDWTYDETEYLFTVEVTEDEDGKLVAEKTITLADGTAVDEMVAEFVNKYTGSEVGPGPEPSDPSTPDQPSNPDNPGGNAPGGGGTPGGGATPGTGDDTDYGLVVGLAGLGVGIVAVCLVIWRIRRRDEEGETLDPGTTVDLADAFGDTFNDIE